MKIFCVRFLWLLFVLICFNNKTQAVTDNSESINETSNASNQSAFEIGLVKEGNSSEAALRGSTVPLQYTVLVKTPAGTCSASLIYVNFVLTLASCVYGYKVDELSVFLGTGAIDDEFDIVRNVTQLNINPLYNESGWANDIAMIRLAQPVIGSDQLVEIDRDPFSDKSISCVATGYNDGIPLKVKASVVEDEVACPCLAERDFFCINEYTVNDRYIGDKGGPLICNDKLIGIRFAVYDETMCSKTEINTDNALNFYEDLSTFNETEFQDTEGNLKEISDVTEGPDLEILKAPKTFETADVTETFTISNDIVFPGVLKANNIPEYSVTTENLKTLIISQDLDTSIVPESVEMLDVTEGIKTSTLTGDLETLNDNTESLETSDVTEGIITSVLTQYQETLNDNTESQETSDVTEGIKTSVLTQYQETLNDNTESQETSDVTEGIKTSTLTQYQETLNDNTESQETSDVTEGLKSSILTGDLETLKVMKTEVTPDVNDNEFYDPSRYYAEIKRNNNNKAAKYLKEMKDEKLIREIHSDDSDQKFNSKLSVGEEGQQSNKELLRQGASPGTGAKKSLVVYAKIIDHMYWIDNIVISAFPNEADFPVNNFQDEDEFVYPRYSKAKKLHCSLKFLLGLLLVSMLYIQ